MGRVPGLRREISAASSEHSIPEAPEQVFHQRSAAGPHGTSGSVSGTTTNSGPEEQVYQICHVAVLDLNDLSGLVCGSAGGSGGPGVEFPRVPMPPKRNVPSLAYQYLVFAIAKCVPKQS